MAARKPLVYKRYRERTVTDLCKALHWVWVTLLRKAHSTTVPWRARNKLMLACGRNTLMLIIVGDPTNKFLKTGQAVPKMLRLLEQDNSLAEDLHRDVLLMIQVIHDRMASCRHAAIAAFQKAERSERPDDDLAESKGWWRAYDILRDCRQKIVETGFLQEIPNTKQIISLQEERLRDYAIKLDERWRVIQAALRGSKLDAYAKNYVSRLAQLSIFRGLRAQEAGKAASGIDGHVEFLIGSNQRKTRAWYADIADDIAQIEELARSLKRSLSQVTNDATRASLYSAYRILDITIENVLGARVFAHVPR